MGKMLKSALEFINDHPRIILLLAWPVFTALIVFLIFIVWQGPWIASAAIQMKQLDILAGIAFCVAAILALNQLAQSSSFFGRLSAKVGNWFDLAADMDGPAEQRTTTVVQETVTKPVAVEEKPDVVA